MRKKLRVLFLGLSLISLISGCNAEDKSSGKKNQVVELEFFQQKNEARDVYDEIINLFEKENPNIRINQVSPADAETVFLTRVATNDIPDLMSVYPAETVYKEIQKSGILMDIKNESFVNKSQDVAIKMSMYNGNLYCMPYAMSTFGIFCNKQLFEENGVELPKTYAQLIECCEILRAKGITSMIFADKDVSEVSVQGERILGIIKNDVYSDLEKIGIGQVEQDSLDYIQKMAECMLELREYAQEGTLAVGREQAVSDFVNGKGAMYITGSWSYAAIYKIAPELDVVMIPMPNPVESDTKIPINIDIAIGISAHTKYPEEAKKFLEFCSRPEINQIMADKETTPSVIKGCDYKVEAFQDIREKMLDENQSFLTVLNFLPSGMRNEWAIYMQELIAEKDIDKFLDESINVCNQYYKQ